MKHLGPLFLSLFLINFQKTAANPNQYPDYDASFSYSEYQVDDFLNSEYSGKDHFQIVFSQKSITCSMYYTFTLIFSLADSVCPENYKEYPGDVPGWGSIMSLPSFWGSSDLPPINDMNSCAYACNLTPDCCSFEFSQTEVRCNLNTECGPTSTENYNDYTFCGKSKSRVSLI